MPAQKGYMLAMEFDTPCVCATLRRAARAITAAYDAALAPSGLRITQFSILRRLARLGPLPVTRLAAESALDRSTIGRNLNPLERRGLVRIEVGNVDQRERVAYWTRQHPDRVQGIAYMEAIVQPITWADFPEDARSIFQGFRSNDGEMMVLEKNLFVESVLPGATLRKLSDEEMAAYRAPFVNAGEDRRPTLTWPRQIPIEGEPPEVV